MISVWAVLEVQMKNGNNKQLFSFLTIAPPFDKASSTSSFSCAFARMLASFGSATFIGQTELFSMVLEIISGPLKMIVRLLCMWLSHGCFIIIVLFFMSPGKKTAQRWGSTAAQKLQIYRCADVKNRYFASYTSQWCQHEFYCFQFHFSFIFYNCIINTCMLKSYLVV